MFVTFRLLCSFNNESYSQLYCPFPLTVTCIWRFPKIGVPPNHPVYFVVFHYKTSILIYFDLFWGSPMYGNLQITVQTTKKNRIFLMAGWLKAIIFYGPWLSFTSHGTFKPAKRKHSASQWRWHGYQRLSGVIKRGWKIPEVNGITNWDSYYKP